MTMIWIIVALSGIGILEFVFLKKAWDQISRLTEDRERAYDKIEALKADREKIMETVKKLRKIEKKRKEKNEKIHSSDDDDVNDILNSLLSNDR
jgi:cell division protein FtsB